MVPFRSRTNSARSQMPRLCDRRDISLRPRPWARNRRAAKMQMAVAGKCRMAPHPVDGDAQQFRVVFVKLRKKLVVSATWSPQTGLHYVVLRYAYSRNFWVGNAVQRFTVRTMCPSAADGSLEKGCGYENKNPCNGLLSADTFRAAPCAERSRCICQDRALQSRPG